ncbi:hypothetical protein FDECE_5815 [Fusarium decemcellulare]|nr:hypothetical protein FDECE_5815 [Fusarium decemcellulare]
MLLGVLLIPILRKSRADGPAHLTFVGSDLAYSATWKIDLDKAVFETADDPKNWKLWIPYPQSKLFLLMGASMLSKRVSCEDVIINVANPGMTHGTSLMANMEQSWQVRLIRLFMKMLGRPVEMGARQHIHAVVTGPETHGSFLSEGKIKPGCVRDPEDFWSMKWDDAPSPGERTMYSRAKTLPISDVKLAITASYADLPATLGDVKLLDKIDVHLGPVNKGRSVNEFPLLRLMLTKDRDGMSLNSRVLSNSIERLARI